MLCQSLWFICNWFFFPMERDKSSILFFWMWISSCSKPTYWRDCPFPHCVFLIINGFISCHFSLSFMYLSFIYFFFGASTMLFLLLQLCSRFWDQIMCHLQLWGEYWVIVFFLFIFFAWLWNQGSTQHKMDFGVSVPFC